MLEICGGTARYYDVNEDKYYYIRVYATNLGGKSNFMYFVQHGFICRPSDFTVSEDAGIEPRTVATLALANRR
jgi:hypothetical protein